MQELSLNVLDIVQNSIKARATVIEISIFIDETLKTMSIEIYDNGCGMTSEQITQVIDPFYTTRTTRRVGLGVPFFKMSAEMTGGEFEINSTVGVGTVIRSLYKTDSIDFMPLGDMPATMVSLIAVNPDIDFIYTFSVDERRFTLDTREVKQITEGIAINSPEILSFIKDFLRVNAEEIATKGQ
ncbi:MAG: ATP-binding protein [Clostridia bacterium]